MRKRLAKSELKPLDGFHEAVRNGNRTLIFSNFSTARPCCHTSASAGVLSLPLQCDGAPSARRSPCLSCTFRLKVLVSSAGSILRAMRAVRAVHATVDHDGTVAFVASFSR